MNYSFYRLYCKINCTILETPSIKLLDAQLTCITCTDARCYSYNYCYISNYVSSANYLACETKTQKVWLNISLNLILLSIYSNSGVNVPALFANAYINN